MTSNFRTGVSRVRGSLVLSVLLFAAVSSATDDAVDRSPEEGDAELECSLFNFEGVASAYVDLSFTVTAEGTVTDPYVIRSDACDETVIPYFERAALDAVLDFRYRPRVVDGEAVDVDDVRTRITFAVDAESEESEESEESDESVGGAEETD